MADNNTPLLKVEHLHKEFPTGSGFMGGKFSKKVVSAVSDLSFEIRAGETFGLVGDAVHLPGSLCILEPPHDHR